MSVRWLLFSPCLCGICGKALLTGGLAGEVNLEPVYLRMRLAMMAFQVVANIGMNIGLMPVVGITLPFLPAAVPAVQLPRYGAGAQRVCSKP